jgi:hypothetical protein
MDTQALFDFSVREAVRASDPESSRMAAEYIRPHVVRDCREVLAVHYKHRATGLDDFELAELMNRKQTSVGVRRGNLADSEKFDPPLIKALGEPRHSTSPLTQRKVQCWQITEAGIAEHERYLADREKGIG